MHDFIEPELRRILDQLQLETVSGLQIKKVSAGKIPAKLGGIKVFSADRISGSKEEVVLDAEVIYSGDARVLFSLQGVNAEINKIHFKSAVRIILKPILDSFPFIGGFEFYFLNRPTLDYSLGGIGVVAEMPGFSQLVKTIVEGQIKSRFVWPNRFRLSLPIDAVKVKRMSNKRLLLPRPGGILRLKIVEGRNLMKKDKSLTGKRM